MKKPEIVVIAWYHPHQWAAIRSCSEDRDGMAEKFSDWEEGAQRTAKKFESDGSTVRKTPVDLDALVAWCKSHGLPVNGKSRADFAIHIASVEMGLTKES